MIDVGKPSSAWFPRFPDEKLWDGCMGVDGLDLMGRA